MDNSILFLVKDYHEKDFKHGSYNHKNRLISQAAKANKKIYISSWNNLIVKNNKVFITRGIIKNGGKESQIKDPVAIYPAYINTHVNPVNKTLTINNFNYEVFSYLIKHSVIKNNLMRDDVVTNKYVRYLIGKFWKKSQSSYNPHISYIGKWYLEKYLKKAEKNDIFVKRPTTILSHKADLLSNVRTAFKEWGEDLLIVKPHTGSRMEGIILLQKKSYLKDLKEIEKVDDEYFVIQKYIANTCTYKNRKVDLRIYVGVFSWNPLVFRVYPYGLTRIASKPVSAKDVTNLDRAITTFGLLSGHLGHNITMDEYFESIKSSSKKEIWDKIHKEIDQTLKGILIGGDLPLKALKNTTYLLGFDVMLAQEKDTCVPYIIEVNHFPTLYRSKENDPTGKTNSLLDKSHHQFFKDAVDYSSIHKLPPASYK